jgi:MFS family permease
MASEQTPLLAGVDARSDEHGPTSKSKDDGKVSPYLIETTRTRFWVMYTPVLLVIFVAMFDSTLMASSHPVITSYFHSSDSASWLSTVFMLTSTTFQPLYGRLSDAFGRKPLYVFSLVTFGVTTAWCGLSQSITSFIAARAFCGLGAGGVLAMVSLQFFD